MILIALIVAVALGIGAFILTLCIKSYGGFRKMKAKDMEGVYYDRKKGDINNNQK